MRSRGVVICCLLYVLMILSSCEHKELCLHHNHVVPVRVDVDWGMFDEETVTGMTLYAYPQQLNETVMEYTSDITHQVFLLYPDTYRFMVHNQTASEFSTVEFLDMYDYQNARAEAASTTSKWYSVKSEDEEVAQESQWLAVNTSEPVEVTMKMLNEHYERNTTWEQSEQNATWLTTLTPKNVVYTVTVLVKNIKQMYNFADIRGSISDMAKCYYINRGHNGQETATYLLEEWNIYRDSSDPTTGSATAVFRCFGLPFGHSGAASENYLNLQILLVNGEILSVDPIGVGDLFRTPADCPSGDLQLELNIDLNIVLPDVPDNGEGGFDASVDEWEEEEIVDIEF